MRSIIILCILLAGAGCDGKGEPASASGLVRASVKVPTGPDGMSIEQRNVRDRLVLDNQPGSIKHLYVISAYSGQTLLYSTVKGKVTSSGKRLSPTAVVVGTSGEYKRPGFDTGLGDTVTGEVLQDDGTYGSSVEYLFWWDQRGVYHQHYVSGGQILHISDQPVAVKSVVINMETVGTVEK